MKDTSWYRAAGRGERTVKTCKVMEKIYDDAEAARRVIEDVLTFLVEAELVEETSQFLRNVEDTVRSNSSDTCGGSSEEV